MLAILCALRDGSSNADIELLTVWSNRVRQLNTYNIDYSILLLQACIRHFLKIDKFDVQHKHKFVQLAIEILKVIRQLWMMV